MSCFSFMDEGGYPPPLEKNQLINSGKLVII